MVRRMHQLVDYILPGRIPYKGEILTRISAAVERCRPVPQPRDLDGRG